MFVLTRRLLAAENTTRVVQATISDRLSVITVPILQDNYSYVLIPDAEPRDGQLVSVVDPGEAAPLLRLLSKARLRVSRILLTHHHDDHIAGTAQIIEESKRNGVDSVELVAPKADLHRIDAAADPSQVTRPVSDGSAFRLTESPATSTRDGADGAEGDSNAPLVQVVSTPCHTSGHVCYLVDRQTAFTGDTLFVGGVGRFFEGTAHDMFHSLERLKTSMLSESDDDASSVEEAAAACLIFCGHEYTESNLEFALSLEPGNGRLEERFRWAQSRRREDLPTVPSRLADEFRTNPFLRTSEKALAKRLGFIEFNPDRDSDQIELLATLRDRKDHFRYLL